MIAFANSFFSYLLLVVIFAAVIAAGIAVGITLRKRKDKKLAAENENAAVSEESA